MTELIESILNKCRGKKQRRASLTRLILCKFRGICRKKRSQRNIARFHQWEIPNDFTEWYFKECAKADEDDDDEEEVSETAPKPTVGSSIATTRSHSSKKRAAQEEWDKDDDDFEIADKVNPPKDDGQKTPSRNRKK
jgi:hypothetical protein